MFLAIFKCACVPLSLLCASVSVWICAHRSWMCQLSVSVVWVSIGKYKCEYVCLSFSFKMCRSQCDSNVYVCVCVCLSVCVSVYVCLCVSVSVLGRVCSEVRV